MVKVTNSVSSQDKHCPRGAYIGLCEAGLIQGILASTHTSRTGKNGDYAVRAHSILRRNPELAKAKKVLWRMASLSQTKKENGQIDVVLALWNKGLLVP